MTPHLRIQLFHSGVIRNVEVIAELKRTSSGTSANVNLLWKQNPIWKSKNSFSIIIEVKSLHQAWATSGPRATSRPAKHLKVARGASYMWNYLNSYIHCKNTVLARDT